MKANELMIGDWVLIKRTPSCEYPYKICSINNYSILGEDYADWIEVEAGEEINLEDIKPIPLTAEILEKNGFVELMFDDKGEETLNGTPLKIFRLCINEIIVEVGIYHPDFINIRYEQYTPDGINEGDISSICKIDGADIAVHELQHALRLCGIDKEIVL